MTGARQPLVRTPLFPLYAEVAALLHIFDGISKDQVRSLIKAVDEQTGTPQNTVDWSQPSLWIPERLNGTDRQLAQRIWDESQHTVNPRHIYGAYLFINTYQLLSLNAAGQYRLEQRGNDFIACAPALLRELDEAEGVPQLLAILAAHSPGKRADLLEEWTEFLLENSNYKTPSSINATLRQRLLNLTARGYVSREGNTYNITSAGLDYAAPQSASPQLQAHHNVFSAIKDYNAAQTTALRERLECLDPYRFEELIKDLLEAMDYENVQVTKQSGDKGVDVIANFQFGITEIKEVVQVKRHKANITRPVLDQLRGALPLHGALRGTIITIGGFAKGCKDVALFPGAAPITLIDGDKLIELLIKHGVGIKQKKLSLLEVDDSYFEGSPAEPLTE
ncbi:restriction endonuclease [Pseudomonas protegens]|uniref:restriction endonuclease n=1 Tax=Pseudomonas protegens TaxID=380021 RepID=UPI000F4C8F3D|nr:restriction endonuclease [Pseudomonas protegens]ROL64986.1 restriction endonuclease [Pseudomonas protegens]